MRGQGVLAEARTISPLDHWGQIDNHNPKWDKRAAAALSLCTSVDRWICDLGCGRQAIRPLLAAGDRYLPMDVKAWTPDTLVCDVNAGLLPRHYLEACDYCLLLGVIGYVEEPGWLLGSLGETVPMLIMSWTVPLTGGRHEAFRFDRIRTFDQLAGDLAAAGFDILDRIEQRPGHFLIKARNMAELPDRRRPATAPALRME